MKLSIVSASRLEGQSWLMVSSNECLDLWSRRWRKFTDGSVRYFILLGLWHWKKLFGAGLMKLRMPSLKELKLVVEFGITGSSLFQSITVEGKKLFFNKLCLMLIQGISLVFLVLSIVLLEGTSLNW